MMSLGGIRRLAITGAAAALLRSMSFAGHFVTRLPTSLSQRGVGSADLGGSASLSFAPVEPERPGVFAPWTATPYDGGRDFGASRFFIFYYFLCEGTSVTTSPGRHSDNK